jgi:hypothetical protein
MFLGCPISNDHKPHFNKKTFAYGGKHKFARKNFSNHLITFQDSISTFKELKDRCWQGALETLKNIQEAGKEEELMDLLEEQNWETFDKINDYLWHDYEDIMKELGIETEEAKYEIEQEELIEKVDDIIDKVDDWKDEAYDSEEDYPAKVESAFDNLGDVSLKLSRLSIEASRGKPITLDDFIIPINNALDQLDKATHKKITADLRKEIQDIIEQ